MSIKYSQLKKKEVYYIDSGVGLGKINDLIIDEKSGRIEKICVPGKKGMFNFSCDKHINFCCIEKIGPDAVLIKSGDDNIKIENIEIDE